MSMVGIFPAQLLGETVETVKRKPRKHTAHKMHAISYCPDCGATLLLACVWKTRVAMGFCIYTKKVEKRHRCGKA